MKKRRFYSRRRSFSLGAVFARISGFFSGFSPRIKRFFSALFLRIRRFLVHLTKIQKIIGAAAACVVVAGVVLACALTGGGSPRVAAAVDAMSPAELGEEATLVSYVGPPEEIAIPVSASVDEAADSEPLPTLDPTLKRGMENDRVTELQTRLMELGYLDIDEPTKLYGPATRYAVILFQRQHGLDMDGIAGPKTLAMIYSDNAKKYTLLEGTRGTDVDSFQERLVELGYLSKVTGYYGTETIEAVKKFQERNNLAVDGKAGENTFDLIYSPEAKQSAEKAAEERRQGNIDAFIAAAEKQLGKRYVLGAAGPKTFDCSGLVTYCLRQAGSSTGRYNAAGFSKNSRWEKITSINSLKRGDLIFFYNNARSKVGHVGIILDGNTMIDASSANGKVVKRSYKTSYWRRMFVCGRRPW